MPNNLNSDNALLVSVPGRCTCHWDKRLFTIITTATLKATMVIVARVEIDDEENFKKFKKEFVCL